MLNIFNLRLNNTKLVKPDYLGNDIGQTRHYPPANKEWFNSIYAYNKDSTKLLAVTDKVILKIIKAYFNLYSKKLEKKIKPRRLRMRFRRRSTNRILVSRAELKHSSDKVIVTLYVYNRQKNYYLNKTRNSVFSLLQKDSQFSVKTEKKTFLLKNFISVRKYVLGLSADQTISLEFKNKKKIYNTKKNTLKFIDYHISKYRYELAKLAKKKKNIIKRYFYRKLGLKKGSLDIISKIRKEKLLLINGFLRILPEGELKEKKTFILHQKFRNYEKIYLKQFISKYRKYLREDRKHVYFKQIKLFNEFKFKNTYLLPLTALIEKLYKKKIVFNLVNLKYLYLNSYIFTETIVTKLRTRQNRLSRVLRVFLRMFKKPSLEKLITYDDLYNKKKKIQNPKFNLLKSYSIFNISSADDINKYEDKPVEKNSLNLDKILNILVPENLKQKSKIYVTNTVLHSIKYKSVSGIRLEAAGRLTKRFTAARSLFSIKVI